jgi:hypothetical protein
LQLLEPPQVSEPQPGLGPSRPLQVLDQFDLRWQEVRRIPHNRKVADFLPHVPQLLLGLFEIRHRIGLMAAYADFPWLISM